MFRRWCQEVRAWPTKRKNFRHFSAKRAWKKRVKGSNPHKINYFVADEGGRMVIVKKADSFCLSSNLFATSP
jgi:hypothetical protein